MLVCIARYNGECVLCFPYHNNIIRCLIKHITTGRDYFPVSALLPYCPRHLLQDYGVRPMSMIPRFRVSVRHFQYMKLTFKELRVSDPPIIVTSENVKPTLLSPSSPKSRDTKKRSPRKQQMQLLYGQDDLTLTHSFQTDDPFERGEPRQDTTHKQQYALKINFGEPGLCPTDSVKIITPKYSQATEEKPGMAQTQQIHSYLVIEDTRGNRKRGRSLSGFRRDSLKKLNQPIMNMKKKSTDSSPKTDKERDKDRDREKDKEEKEKEKEKDRSDKKPFRGPGTKSSSKIMRIDKSTSEKERKEKKNGMFSFGKRPKRKSGPNTKVSGPPPSPTSSPHYKAYNVEEKETEENANPKKEEETS